VAEDGLGHLEEAAVEPGGAVGDAERVRGACVAAQVRQQDGGFGDVAAGQVAAEEEVDGNAEQAREVDEEIDVGDAVSELPLGDGLGAHLESGGQTALGESQALPSLADPPAHRVLVYGWHRLVRLSVLDAILEQTAACRKQRSVAATLT
jgi:hypothetical protein